MEAMCCKIPLKVIESMIIMCERINEDIASIATDEELNDQNTRAYSLRYANEIVMMGLKKSKNDLLQSD